MTKAEIMKLAEFDVERAKKYGRDLFGGARDTIGESYVLQAMRNQYDKDKLFIEELAESTEKVVDAASDAAALYKYLVVESGAPCPTKSFTEIRENLYAALADHAERMEKLK